MPIWKKVYGTAKQEFKSKARVRDEKLYQRFINRRNKGNDDDARDKTGSTK